MSPLQVVLETDDLLAFNKPAGLVCHPTKGGPESSLVGRIRLQLGIPQVFLINRLDRETSGLVLIARSAAVAGELGRLFESREVRKEYLALVHGHPASDSIEVSAPLGKDVHSEVAIRDTVLSEGNPACTRFTVLQRLRRGDGDFSLLQALPITGRKHQIRIHLEHVGHPIVGDKIYGGDPRRYLRFVEGRMTDEDRKALILENQALHAARITFRWRDRWWNLEAPPEAEFLKFLNEAGADLRTPAGANPPTAIAPPEPA